MLNSIVAQASKDVVSKLVSSAKNVITKPLEPYHEGSENSMAYQLGIRYAIENKGWSSGMFALSGMTSINEYQKALFLAGYTEGERRNREIILYEKGLSLIDVFTIVLGLVGVSYLISSVAKSMK